MPKRLSLLTPWMTPLSILAMDAKSLILEVLWTGWGKQTRQFFLWVLPQMCLSPGSAVLHVNGCTLLPHPLRNPVNICNKHLFNWFMHRRESSALQTERSGEVTEERNWAASEVKPDDPWDWWLFQELHNMKSWKQTRFPLKNTVFHWKTL